MIPLSIPNISGNEWKYVKDCLDTGWISSVGEYVNRFEQALTEFTGARYAVATMNGTAALHISLQLAGVRPGDLVIVPNITFVASCNAITYAGATPLLVDIDPRTWQMDLDLLEEFLEAKTEIREDDQRIRPVLKNNGRQIGALMPVHVLGNMVDMDRLMQIASRFHLPIVEDSTEALGSYYNGKHAGRYGLFGTFSFNGNKIISTGGGGMIVTDDEALAKQAKHLTTTAKVDPFEYRHDAIGYNYRLVNILAAVGVAQVEQLPGFLARKKIIDMEYRDGLEKPGYVRFQKIGVGVEHNCWLHTLQTERQEALISHLLQNGIQCRPFWVPMNQLPMFAGCIYVSENDTSSHVYRSCISIPSSTNLTEDQVAEVIRVIQVFFQ